jgi:hypothetical protein
VRLHVHDLSCISAVSYFVGCFLFEMDGENVGLMSLAELILMVCIFCFFPQKILRTDGALKGHTFCKVLLFSQL